MAFNYSPKTVTSGLVLYLDAANPGSYTSGSTVWNNLTINTPLSATFQNGVTYLTSSAGALSFSSASLQSVTGSDLGSLNRFTVSCWFNLTTLPTTAGAAAIVTNAYPGTTSQLNFSIGLNNSPSTANICGGFFDGAWRTTAGFAPTINTWYNTVCTYDGVTILQYLNGSAQSSASYAGTPITSNAGIRIGRRWDTGAGVDHINGQIPIIQIYNRSLSATEVLQNYNALKSRFNLR